MTNSSPLFQTHSKSKYKRTLESMLKAKDMMKKLTLLKLEIVLISYNEGAHLLEPLALVSLFPVFLVLRKSSDIHLFFLLRSTSTYLVSVIQAFELLCCCYYKEEYCTVV